MLCDDPWLFREIARLPDVVSETPPSRFARRLKAYLRGTLARIRVAIRAAFAALRQKLKRLESNHRSYLLVYGHPASTASKDAYFGNLMEWLPDIRRAVHTDDFAVFTRLAVDGRTESLHAYGAPLYALVALPFATWRPSQDLCSGPWGYLIDRAATIERSGGAAAMTRWQFHCQLRWIDARRPARIAWTWENHPWERALAVAARAAQIPTIGYQDTDVGPHQFNMSAYATPNGIDDLPDILILNGPAYRDQLVSWGIPASRLVIGGAFRMPVAAVCRYDVNGPVFVALSPIPEISREMMEAVHEASRSGRVFMVKAHPMYPFNFTPTDSIRRTDKPFSTYPGVSAMLYGTGTSGIEGLLSGVPTFRLVPSTRLGIETMPEGLRAQPVTRETLGAALDASLAPPPASPETFFTPVDTEIWRRHLAPALDSAA